MAHYVVDTSGIAGYVPPSAPSGANPNESLLPAAPAASSSGGEGLGTLLVVMLLVVIGGVIAAAVLAGQARDKPVETAAVAAAATQQILDEIQAVCGQCETATNANTSTYQVLQEIQDICGPRVFGTDVFVFDLFTSMNRSTVEEVIAAVQLAVNRDYAGVWSGNTANLRLLPRGVTNYATPNPSSFNIYLVEESLEDFVGTSSGAFFVIDPDIGNDQPGTSIATGLPDVSIGHMVGLIVYGTTLTGGLARAPFLTSGGHPAYGTDITSPEFAFSATLSSILFSMLGDRKDFDMYMCNEAIRGDFETSGIFKDPGLVANLGAANHYTVLNYPISNFATPEWYFELDAGAGTAYDFLGNIDAPHKLYGGHSYFLGITEPGCALLYVNVSHWYNPQPELTAAAGSFGGNCSVFLSEASDMPRYHVVPHPDES